MISIVVSSYKEDLFSNFKRSIELTIGDIPYEIIRIYNPGVMSIGTAYNLGGASAQFPYLVFSHEDVLFHSKNWGKTLVEIFERDSTIGLLGVAGSFYKALYYSGWALQPSASSVFMIGSHYGKSNIAKTKSGITDEQILNEDKTIPDRFIEPDNVNEEVVVLDGMFLATQKKVFQKIKFDDSSFKGFHCYDLDYSMQVRKQYKVVVNQNILIEHLSAGTFENDWIKNSKIFTKKWQCELPAANKSYSGNEKAELEFKAFEQFLRINSKTGKGITKSIFHLYKRNYISRIGVVNWLEINYKIAKKFGLLFTKQIFK